MEEAKLKYLLLKIGLSIFLLISIGFTLFFVHCRQEFHDRLVFTFEPNVVPFPNAPWFLWPEEKTEFYHLACAMRAKMVFTIDGAMPFIDDDLSWPFQKSLSEGGYSKITSFNSLAIQQMGIPEDFLKGYYNPSNACNIAENRARSARRQLTFMLEH
jgi:hypothetical protein